MISHNWSSFTLRVTLRASEENIYRMIATAAGLENWFLRKAVFTSSAGKARNPQEFAEAGDMYFRMWHGHPDEVSENRPVLEANGKDLIRFRFTADSDVTFRIIRENETTLLELKQDKIPQEEDPQEHLHVQCAVGWTFYLTNLKSVLEGGPDLRNKDMAIRSVINA